MYSVITQIRQLIITFIGFSLMTVSCSKSDSANMRDSKGIVQVTISDAVFDSEETTISNRAATPLETSVQRNTIPVGNDFLMVSELRPDESTRGAAGLDAKAEIVTSNLLANTRYRLLVYNQVGAFVTERDYIRGQEGSTEALELDGGVTYTFVAVSLNNTNDLPATTPAIATRTLANSRIQVNTGVTALMYQRQTVTVIGNSINRLDIVLKHQKPLISVTINASQTGYNITAAAGNFRPHNNGTLVNLADGTHTQSGNDIPVAVSFNTVGSQTVVSSSNNFINSPSNNATIFTITSITIGSITATNLVPFSDLTVSPGVRYNLILNIVPRDEYVTVSGRPAARINGVVWALHNLGVATTVDPEQMPITSALHGNYYQFGRTAVVANGTSTATNNNWIRNPQSRAAWNAWDATPVKTVLDPCPAGFRVPSQGESQALLDNTNHDTRGVMDNSATHYNSASVFTSRRSASVRLIFPHQGAFGVAGNSLANYVSTGINNRGTSGIVHTSRTNANIIWRLVPNSTGASVAETSDNLANYSSSLPIRCVGI